MVSLTQKMVLNNPYQNSDIQRWLAVCSAGVLRSPTVVKVAYENSMGLNIRSAGTDDLALIQVDEKLLEWADYIICMNYSDADEIVNHFGFMGSVYNFNIEDNYPYADPELEKIIKQRFDNLEQWEF